MYQLCIKAGGTCAILLLLILLSACAGSDSSSNSGNITPTLQSGTVTQSTPGVGPIVISTPTTAPGGNTHYSVVTLPDRTLTLEQVGKQAGADASSTAISITISITNTGKASILNQASFFQLEGAEGDAFGIQSSVTANFYGSIPAQSNRRGTIVFQVPAGAVKGLRLLYHPEITTETVLLPLN